MTTERWMALVRKLEEEASRQPNVYRLKVLGWTGLGYGYICAFLCMFLFLLAASVSILIEDGISYGRIKLLVVTCALSFFILKALLFKMEVPPGYYVQQQEAQELFRMLEELRIKMKTPRIDAVVLNSQLNAAVAQIPKYGLFGPKQNVLLLGIPLLLTLTPARFQAVLAHELAHISHADTAFGAKIYRVRETWERLLRSLEEKEQFGAFLFRWFLKWFFPRYNAYTFVLARQQEYEADRVAAQMTSAQDKAEALCVLTMVAPYYQQDFYDELLERSAMEGIEPYPFSDFAQKVREVKKETYWNYLREGLARESDAMDTHPSLKERLAALHVEPCFVEIGHDSAFYAYFNDARPILQHFDRMWKEQNDEEWQRQVERYRQDRKRLEELTASEEQDVNVLLEKAMLIEQLKGPAEAVAVYEQIVHSFPANEAAGFAYLALGKIYLEEGKPEKGLTFLERAAELSWECRTAALDIMGSYYHFIGDEKNVQQTKQRYERWLETMEEAEKELEYIKADDDFSPPERSAEEMKQCVDLLKKRAEIIEAYLVKKNIKAIPERSYHVLAIIVEGDAEEIEKERSEKYDDLFACMSNTSVVILNEQPRILAAIAEAAGKPLYRRKESQRSSIQSS